MSAPPAPDGLLVLDHVKVEYVSSVGAVTAIPDLSITIRAGESYGLVGESGCGKSTLLMAIMGYLGPTGRIANGRIVFDGADVSAADPASLARIRGRGCSIVYQDPNAALNPTLTIGKQLIEVPMLHEGVDAKTARAKARQILTDVHLPDPDAVLDRYPHQLSGGQKQRVVIAMALLANPKLLLLDEPTTGLDVTVEAAVLDLVNELREKYGTTLLYISHNLGVIAKVCDRVGVMYLGDLVEEAPVHELFANPRHPYTRRLLACVPRLDTDKHTTTFLPIPGQPPSLAGRPRGCSFGPRCAGFDAPRCGVAPIPEEPAGPGHGVRCVRWRELDQFEKTDAEHVAPATPGVEQVMRSADLSKVYDLGNAFMGFGSSRQLIANEDLSFQANKGEILAIVGESGSGKSTFARILAGLQDASAGKLMVLGDDLSRMPAHKRTLEQLAAVQMVFQNPDATLNPSHTAGFSIGRALKKFGIAQSRKDLDARVKELFGMVRLSPHLARQRPGRLSGGQKQRVAIARAFAGDPKLLVADEPVSALDVSVQAAIVNLLLQIQARNGATIVFISHDLALVRHLADRVVVMYLGRVMEMGPVSSIFSPPYHPYTEALLAAVPVPDPTVKQKHLRLEGEPPSPINVPLGCRFAARCPRKLGPVCDETPPPEQAAPDGHMIACHIPVAVLARVTPIFQRVQTPAGAANPS
ncbi:ABC transporter ATP-binding protein [Alsobacter metallidurans]|uniref:ABC transporter ATP-binding protein n=1 Tax=Alsobacter metallidurans TaxID=340221 RepID=A0A917I790_9HYPH|nr:ABC transporter ATP-binding protein [Alsobacter metallidurans]GGH19758.1 ABC transporter ATP-binding protein [Alsobacter metallidurans]